MRYRDAKANGDLEKIAKSFLNDVNSGVIKIDFIELEKHRCNRKRNELDKNYKPVKNKAANAVFDIYKDFIPRKFRDKNIFEAIEHHTKDFLKLLNDFKDMNKPQ